MFSFTLPTTGQWTGISYYLKSQTPLAEVCAAYIKQIRLDFWSFLFYFVCALCKFRNGREVLNCPGMYQHTPMHIKIHLQFGYFSFSFTLSSNKDNMLIFDAKDNYEALDMVQKSQQFYTSG